MIHSDQPYRQPNPLTFQVNLTWIAPLTNVSLAISACAGSPLNHSVTTDQDPFTAVDVDIPFLVVAVAQLVEHRIVVPVVAGSNPVSHPNLYLIATPYFEHALYQV